MAELSQITLPSGITYDLKDEVARAALASGTTFLGVTTTALTDGATTQTIVISGESVSAVNGGIAIYQNAEFIYASTDSKWHEIGDTTGLGALALKDSATGQYTPAGSVSTPTITVTPSTTTKYVASSATGGGAVTAGSAAACTLPVLTLSVANENLTIGWSAGSFTANTPTSVTLPTFSSQTIATGISSATSTQPTFTGTQAVIEVS